MILQILQTLAITMGIATSVKTTNFEYEKKARRNETESIHFEYEEAYNQVGSIYSYSTTGQNIEVEKWLVSKDESATSIPTYTTPYLNVANTSYMFRMSSKNSNYYEIWAYGIYQITNYYNSQITLNIRTLLSTAANDNNPTVANQKFIRTKNGTSNLIDLTLTNSLYDTIQTELQNTTVYSADYTGTTNNDEYTQQNYNVNLTINETITVYFILIRHNTISNYDNTHPTRFNLSGTAQIPTTPIEVVDIPNIMFTILTMPFSFFSQAFNLTIFPNTPYQLNFSNLFLTLIAVFFLLWIIKHIFGK